MSRTPKTVDRMAQATSLAMQASSVRWQAVLQTRTGYRDYLLATYQYVLCSVPLMEAALAESSHQEVPGLGPYLARHIEEERGHDKWLAEDLESLGVATSDLSLNLPPPAVLHLTGPQYHLIRHVHPVALLGYIFVLESGPPDPAFLNALRRRLALPAQALRTLEAHAVEDISHREDLARLIDSLPAGRPHAELVVYSAELAACGLLDLIKSLKQTAHEDRPRLSSAL